MARITFVLCIARLSRALQCQRAIVDLHIMELRREAGYRTCGEPKAKCNIMCSQPRLFPPLSD